jgi:hypothetical protein
VLGGSLSRQSEYVRFFHSLNFIAAMTFSLFSPFGIILHNQLPRNHISLNVNPS